MEYNKNNYIYTHCGPDDWKYDKRRYQDLGGKVVEGRIADEEYWRASKIHVDPRGGNRKQRSRDEMERIGMRKSYEDWKREKRMQRNRNLEKEERRKRNEEMKACQKKENNEEKERKSQLAFEEWKIRKAREEITRKRSIEKEKIEFEQKKEQEKEVRHQLFKEQFEEMIQHHKSRINHEKQQLLQETQKKKQERTLKHQLYASRASSRKTLSKSTSQASTKPKHTCPSPLLLAYTPNTSHSLELAYSFSQVERRISNLNVNLSDVNSETA
jgi:hypothetical protein